MSGHPVDFTRVDELAAALVAGGVRSADVDVRKVNLPGVWVKVSGLRYDLLDGYTILTTLYLIAADKDPRRTMTDLQALVNKVTAVVDPTGDVVAVELAMPDGTALPALALPFDLYAT